MSFLRFIDIAGNVVLLLALITIYAMPTMIAIRRHHPQRLAIGVLNGLAGWTVLGWVGALAWSLTAFTPSVKSTDRAYNG